MHKVGDIAGERFCACDGFFATLCCANRVMASLILKVLLSISLTCNESTFLSCAFLGVKFLLKITATWDVFVLLFMRTSI